MSGPAHSPLGPSSAERWMKCPASVRATAGLPDVETEYSLEGTAAHAVAEWCRERNLPTKAFPESEIKVEGSDGRTHVIEVTQEMRDHVQSFIDYVNETDGEALNESRISYEQYVPGGFGTLDAAIMRPGVCTVVDLKYGKGVQKFAERNEQLMLYALGIYLAWNWLYDFQTFLLVVFQPRLEHEDIWHISVDDLLKWAEDRLVPAYRETLNPQAAFVPGEHCQFCKIKATCAARAQSVFKAVTDEFENLDEPVVEKTTIAVERATTLTNDQIARALEALPNVKSWCKAIEAHATRELAAGRAVGTFKLVEGRSNRAWAVDETDVIAALKTADVAEENLYERKLISPTAAEKLIGKKHEIWAADPPLVAKPPGKPTLAPGDDRRPALNIDPTKAFDVIDEE